MLRGSGFTDADERDHSAVVVLSYGFWTGAFSQRPFCDGRTLYVKGVPFTITGVAAPSLSMESGRGSATDFWVPLQDRSELNAWGAPVSRADFFGSSRWWDLPMVAGLQPRHYSAASRAGSATGVFASGERRRRERSILSAGPRTWALSRFRELPDTRSTIANRWKS